MAGYEFVFEINGVKAGTCTSIGGLEEVGHKIQPGSRRAVKLGPGQLAGAKVEHKVGLLLPAIQAAQEKSRYEIGRSDSPVTQKVSPAAHKISPLSHKVSPLSHKVSPVAYKVNPVAHKVSPAGSAPLILYGFQAQPGAPEWVSSRGDRPTPRSGILKLRDERGRTVAQWSFINAWPSKISGPNLKADSNDVGVEEMTLSFEGLTRTL